MTNVAVAVVTWLLLAGGFWAADTIAQLKADRMRERNNHK